MLLDDVDISFLSLRPFLDDKDGALSDFLWLTSLVQSAETGVDGELLLLVNGVNWNVVGLAESSHELLVVVVVAIISKEAQDGLGSLVVGALNSSSSFVDSSSEVIFTECSLANLTQGNFKISSFSHFRFN